MRSSTPFLSFSVSDDSAMHSFMQEISKIPNTTKPNKAQGAVALQKNSQVISKCQPQIRIIHIVAPEIIKTDVANFRDLVQKLTGKPTKPKGGVKKRRTKKHDEVIMNNDLCKAEQVFVEDRFKYCSSNQYGDRPMIKREEEEEEEETMMKEEEERWKGENSTSFLGGFGESDGLVHGFSEFPLFPFNSSHVDIFGEIHLPL